MWNDNYPDTIVRFLTGETWKIVSILPKNNTFLRNNLPFLYEYSWKTSEYILKWAVLQI